MNTVFLDMTHSVDEEGIRQAGEILKNGGLVAFPTETVYGLGGNALDAEASRKIYAAKGRPSDNPLIVHIADIEDLAPIVESVPASALLLAERFWPGPLTMIMKKSPMVPEETTGGLDTVAVRMPDHPVAAALIKAGGGYVAAPSANSSGRPSPVSAAHVREDLDGRIDMILDGGPVEIGLESTIIDLTEEVPMILRPGYISQKMLDECLDGVIMDPAVAALTDPSFSKNTELESADFHPKAPGMKYRHYAPKASLYIVEGSREKVRKAIRELARAAGDEGKRAGIIASDESMAYYDCGIVKNAGSMDDEESIARHLYGILRDFDSLDVDIIYSEAFDTPRMGQAIMNRLIKAAGHQVIYL